MNKKIKNESDLHRAVIQYLSEGRTVAEITEALNERGAICSQVAVQRVINVIEDRQRQYAERR